MFWTRRRDSVATKISTGTFVDFLEFFGCLSKLTQGGMVVSYFVQFEVILDGSVKFQSKSTANEMIPSNLVLKVNHSSK